jgi:hypothetical protein
LLNQFSIPTATQDYFHTSTSGSVTLKGLNPSRGYVFNLFGTRNDPETRISTYTLQGSNQYSGNLTTSGLNLGGTGYNGNNNTILITNTVMPKSNGEIVLTISRTAGSFAYLGILKFEEVEPIYKTMYVDFGPNDVTNGNITTSPDKFGNYWNNVTDPNTTATAVNLVSNTNLATGASISISAPLLKNGIQNGGLLSPSSILLNAFAIPTATQDYFHTGTSGSVTLKGLNPSRGYVFSLFGTRNDPETRITTYTLQGSNQYSGTLTTSGLNIGGTGYNGNNKTILVSETIMPGLNGEIRLTITRTAGSFAYLGVMKIVEVPAIVLQPFCAIKDNSKIAVMGSSVAFGLGASNNQGYVYQYTQQLSNRFNAGKGKKWTVSNISVSGNNTSAVLSRWNRDLLPLCSKYVVYGLSLGNEGIVGGGQEVFNRFRDNLQLLISKSRAEGIEPIIANCYTRGDYTSTEYNYVKQMNLLINSWNVSSVNLLGAVDNGAGQWATGYMSDMSHPNTLGHTELMYSLVPSLFDALDAGKPQPTFVNGTSLSMGAATNYKLEFIPEEVIHPFTISFDVKSTNAGTICQLENSNGLGSLSIVSGAGNVQYRSPSSNGITGNTSITNNQWHKITLTHYYAQGRTLLYIDNVLQGTVVEKIISRKFTIAGENSPVADYRNMLFYRSGMNSSEIAALNGNNLLKSSLELYSPLDAQGITGSDTLVNLAQSTNKIIKRRISNLATARSSSNSNFSDINIYPNPAYNELTIVSDNLVDKVAVIDIHGTELLSGNKNTIDISSLSAGCYTVKIIQQDQVQIRKLIKQ